MDNYYNELINENIREMGTLQLKLTNLEGNSEQAKKIKEEIAFLMRLNSSFELLKQYDSSLLKLSQNNKLKLSEKRKQKKELKEKIANEKRKISNSGKFSEILSCSVNQVDKYVSNFINKITPIYLYRRHAVDECYSKKTKYFSTRFIVSVLAIILGVSTGLPILSALGLIGGGVTVAKTMKAAIFPNSKPDVVKVKEIKHGSFMENLKKSIYRFRKVKGLDIVNDVNVVDKNDVIEVEKDITLDDNKKEMVSEKTNSIDLGFMNNSESLKEVFSLISKIDLDNIDKELIARCYVMYNKLTNDEREQLGYAKDILMKAVAKVKTPKRVDTSSDSFRFDRAAFDNISNLKKSIENIDLNNIDINLVTECMRIYDRLSDIEKRYMDISTMEKLRSACYEYMMKKESNVINNDTSVNDNKVVNVDNASENVRAVIYDYTDNSGNIIDRMILCTIVSKEGKRFCEQLSAQELCENVRIESISSKDYIRTIVKEGLKKRYNLSVDPKIVYSKDVIIERISTSSK